MPVGRILSAYNLHDLRTRGKKKKRNVTYVIMDTYANRFSVSRLAFTNVPSTPFSAGGCNLSHDSWKVFLKIWIPGLSKSPMFEVGSKFLSHLSLCLPQMLRDIFGDKKLFFWKVGAQQRGDSEDPITVVTTGYP